MALGVVAAIAGLIEDSTGALALGLVLVAGPMTVWLTLTRAARRITLSQVAPESAFEGDDVVVRITLCNNSAVSVFHPRLSEIFTPEFDHQKDLVFPDRVAPGERIEARYRGRCVGTRGRYGIGPTALRITDPMGWFEVRQYLAAEADFKVYPRIGSTRSVDPDAMGLARAIQEVTLTGPGAGHEPWTIRDYAPGDPRKRVHWPATARKGNLMVRVDTRVGSGDATLVIDASSRFNRGVGRDATLEHTVRLVATTTAHLTRSRIRVELRTTDGRLDVPLGDGRAVLAAVLESLVDVRPIDGPDVVDLLTESNPPEGGAVILPIGSYLFGDGRLQHLVSTLALRHSVLCVLFDDEDGEETGAAMRWLVAAGARVHIVRRGRGESAP